MRTGIALALMLTLTAGCHSTEQSRGRRAAKAISSDDLALNWPLGVNGGRLECIVLSTGGSDAAPAKAVTFTTADGTVYSVNDVAVAHALGRDISVITRTADPIWITDPQTQSRVQLAAPATSIAPLVEEGLKLCPER